jgi:hypothetical protein
MAEYQEVIAAVMAAAAKGDAERFYAMLQAAMKDAEIIDGRVAGLIERVEKLEHLLTALNLGKAA